MKPLTLRFGSEGILVIATRTGRTHYETLGLPQTASNEEITRAFAKEMSALTPRSIAALAELSVAYETLRDRDRRRAYDASLRPVSVPKPSYAVHWNAAPAQEPALGERQSLDDWRPAIRLSEAAEPGKATSSQRSPEVPSGPKTAARDDSPAVPEEPYAHRERSNWTMLQSPEEDSDHGRRADWRRESRFEGNSVNWKKVAAAIGWPILGVAMIGAVAGWSASIVEQSQQPEDSLNVALPPAKPSLVTADASMLVPPSEDESLHRQAPKRAAVRPIEQPLLPEGPAGESEQLAEAPQPDLLPAENSGAGQGVEQSSSPAPIAASMPLSNRLIARTIGRIGYACGEVASAIPVEGGAPGVFRVTCTSGDSYRASPVRGRYHFRRWAGR